MSASESHVSEADAARTAPLVAEFRASVIPTSLEESRGFEISRSRFIDPVSFAQGAEILPRHDKQDIERLNDPFLSGVVLPILTQPYQQITDPGAEAPTRPASDASLPAGPGSDEDAGAVDRVGLEMLQADPTAALSPDFLESAQAARSEFRTETFGTQAQAKPLRKSAVLDASDLTSPSLVASEPPEEPPVPGPPPLCTFSAREPTSSGTLTRDLTGVPKTCPPYPRALPLSFVFKPGPLSFSADRRLPEAAWVSVALYDYKRLVKLSETAHYAFDEGGAEKRASLFEFPASCANLVLLVLVEFALTGPADTQGDFYAHSVGMREDSYLKEQGRYLRKTAKVRAALGAVRQPVFWSFIPINDPQLAGITVTAQNSSHGSHVPFVFDPQARSDAAGRSRSRPQKSRSSSEADAAGSAAPALFLPRKRECEFRLDKFFRVTQAPNKALDCSLLHLVQEIKEKMEIKKDVSKIRTATSGCMTFFARSVGPTTVKPRTPPGAEATAAAQKTAQLVTFPLMVGSDLQPRILPPVLKEILDDPKSAHPMAKYVRKRLWYAETRPELFPEQYSKIAVVEADPNRFLGAPEPSGDKARPEVCVLDSVAEPLDEGSAGVLSDRSSILTYEHVTPQTRFEHSLIVRFSWATLAKQDYSSSARNIQLVCLLLKDDQLQASSVIPCIYPQFGAHAGVCHKVRFGTHFATAVSYHNKQPGFMAEMKVKLPFNASRHLNMLVAVVHIGVGKTVYSPAADKRLPKQLFTSLFSGALTGEGMRANKLPLPGFAVPDLPGVTLVGHVVVPLSYAPVEPECTPPWRSDTTGLDFRSPSTCLIREHAARSYPILSPGALRPGYLANAFKSKGAFRALTALPHADTPAVNVSLKLRSSILSSSSPVVDLRARFNFLERRLAVGDHEELPPFQYLQAVKQIARDQAVRHGPALLQLLFHCFALEAYFTPGSPFSCAASNETHELNGRHSPVYKQLLLNKPSDEPTISATTLARRFPALQNIFLSILHVASTISYIELRPSKTEAGADGAAPPTPSKLGVKAFEDVMNLGEKRNGTCSAFVSNHLSLHRVCTSIECPAHQEDDTPDEAESASARSPAGPNGIVPAVYFPKLFAETLLSCFVFPPGAVGSQRGRAGAKFSQAQDMVKMVKAQSAFIFDVLHRAVVLSPVSILRVEFDKKKEASECVDMMVPPSFLLRLAAVIVIFSKLVELELSKSQQTYNSINVSVALFLQRLLGFAAITFPVAQELILGYSFALMADATPPPHSFWAALVQRLSRYTQRLHLGDYKLLSPRVIITELKFNFFGIIFDHSGIWELLSPVSPRASVYQSSRSFKAHVDARYPLVAEVVRLSLQSVQLKALRKRAVSFLLWLFLTLESSGALQLASPKEFVDARDAPPYTMSDCCSLFFEIFAFVAQRWKALKAQIVNAAAEAPPAQQESVSPFDTAHHRRASSQEPASPPLHERPPLPRLPPASPEAPTDVRSSRASIQLLREQTKHQFPTAESKEEHERELRSLLMICGFIANHTPFSTTRQFFRGLPPASVGNSLAMLTDFVSLFKAKSLAGIQEELSKQSSDIKNLLLKKYSGAASATNKFAATIFNFTNCQLGGGDWTAVLEALRPQPAHVPFTPSAYKPLGRPGTSQTKARVQTAPPQQRFSMGFSGGLSPTRMAISSLRAGVMPQSQGGSPPPEAAALARSPRSGQRATLAKKARARALSEFALCISVRLLRAIFESQPLLFSEGVAEHHNRWSVSDAAEEVTPSETLEALIKVCFVLLRSAAGGALFEKVARVVFAVVRVIGPTTLFRRPSSGEAVKTEAARDDSLVARFSSVGNPLMLKSEAARRFSKTLGGRIGKERGVFYAFDPLSVFCEFLMRLVPKTKRASPAVASLLFYFLLREDFLANRSIEQTQKRISSVVISSIIERSVPEKQVKLVISGALAIAKEDAARNRDAAIPPGMSMAPHAQYPGREFDEQIKLFCERIFSIIFKTLDIRKLAYATVADGPGAAARGGQQCEVELLADLHFTRAAASIDSPSGRLSILGQLVNHNLKYGRTVEAAMGTIMQAALIAENCTLPATHDDLVEERAFLGHLAVSDLPAGSTIAVRGDLQRYHVRNLLGMDLPQVKELGADFLLWAPHSNPRVKAWAPAIDRPLAPICGAAQASVTLSDSWREQNEHSLRGFFQAACLQLTAAAPAGAEPRAAARPAFHMPVVLSGEDTLRLHMHGPPIEPPAPPVSLARPVLARLLRILPTLEPQSAGRSADAAAEFNIDLLITTLQRAQGLFEEAKYFGFAFETLSLLAELEKRGGRWIMFQQTARKLAEVGARLGKAMAEPSIARCAPVFFRVGFYGPEFGADQDGREYIYMLAPGTGINDLIERLRRFYVARARGEKRAERGGGAFDIEVIRTSGDVDVRELDFAGKAYMQVSTVTPFRLASTAPWDAYDGAPDGDRVAAFQLKTVHVRRYSPNEPKHAPANLEERRTVFFVDHPFPWVKSRQRVARRASALFNPVQRAASVLFEKIAEMQRMLAPGAPQLVEMLTGLLKGAIAPEVNAGFAAFAESFLAPTNVANYDAKDIALLRKTLVDFMCTAHDLLARILELAPKPDEMCVYLQESFARGVAALEELGVAFE